MGRERAVWPLGDRLAWLQGRGAGPPRFLIDPDTLGSGALCTAARVSTAHTGLCFRGFDADPVRQAHGQGCAVGARRDRDLTRTALSRPAPLAQT